MWRYLVELGCVGTKAGHHVPCELSLHEEAYLHNSLCGLPSSSFSFFSSSVENILMSIIIVLQKFSAIQSFHS